LDKTIKNNKKVNHSKANYNKVQYYKHPNQKVLKNIWSPHLGPLGGKNQGKKKDIIGVKVFI
jgi:hypothetical protein